MSRVEELGRPSWFLVPERQDRRPQFGNGELQNAGTMAGLVRELARLAGGVTRGLRRTKAEGVWEEILDPSTRIEVGLPAEKEPRLVEILAEFASRLGQECIYLVLGGQRALLVYRKATDDDAEGDQA